MKKEFMQYMAAIAMMSQEIKMPFMSSASEVPQLQHVKGGSGHGGVPKLLPLNHFSKRKARRRMFKQSRIASRPNCK